MHGAVVSVRDHQDVSGTQCAVHGAVVSVRDHRDISGIQCAMHGAVLSVRDHQDVCDLHKVHKLLLLDVTALYHCVLVIRL